MVADDFLRAVSRCRRGTAAIEFALVAPVFLLLVFGIITFGAYLSAVNGVQQLAAEAARAAVAGLSDSERISIAQASVATHAAGYPFLDPTKVRVASTVTNADGFSITLRYDASTSPLFKLPFAVLLPAMIVRSASVQRGGY